MQDDPQTSGFLKPPGFVSGGGGLVSTAADYLRFCRMLLNGGALDGVRLVSPKTLELMSMNHLPGGKELPDLSVSLFSEATYGGVGFGLGFAVSMSPARAMIPGSAGDVSWGGLASTYFWVDPRERLIVIFMTQLTPSRDLSDPPRAAHARLLRVHLNACRKRTPSVSSACRQPCAGDNARLATPVVFRRLPTCRVRVSTRARGRCVRRQRTVNSIST